MGCGNIKQLQLTIQLLGSQQHFLISSIIYYQALSQTYHKQSIWTLHMKTKRLFSMSQGSTLRIWPMTYMTAWQQTKMTAWHLNISWFPAVWNFFICTWALYLIIQKSPVQVSFFCVCLARSERTLWIFFFDTPKFRHDRFSSYIGSNWI